MPAHPDEINDLIRRRRTIKPAQMDSRPIDREIIGSLLESANWAPTHGMTEPWRFVVYSGDARQRLGEFLSHTYREIIDDAEFKPNKFESLRKNPMLAPVVIAIGMKRQPSGKIPEIEEVAAVACAVQNMHLHATAYGLGGFWSSNVAATSDAMREFIGLDEGDRALGLFYLGYPRVEWPTGQRTPAANKIRWVDDRFEAT